MNSKIKMTLAALAGAVLGAAAIQALHAQAKPPVYTVTEIDVTNVDAYMKEYVPIVQPIIKKGGGKLLAASLKITAIEGTAPKRVAINVWDSLEKAQALYTSPNIRKLRKSATSTLNFAVMLLRDCRSRILII